MSRSLRHGAFAATALVFSIATLSACAAGNDAQTLQVRPDNAATAVDSIKIQNLNIITQPDPETEGPAVIAATLFNDGPKREVVEKVTLPGTNATVELKPAKGKGPVVIPAADGSSSAGRTTPRPSSRTAARRARTATCRTSPSR